MLILIKAGQLLLSLSILVIFHELGHYFFARLFRTRVEKFYLFFDPWFSLFKFKHGETEYGIGWIPLGGYVKISGMIDESMDKKQLQNEPQPWEFRSKPAWQRLLIMIGGVMVNFVLAISLYIMVLYIWGEEYLPAHNAKYGIYCDSLALDAGLQNGDIIAGIDNKKVDNFRSIVPTIILNQSKTLQIERKGKIEEIQLPRDLIAKIIKKETFFIDVAFPFVIKGFVENSPAKEAGLQPGDIIYGINNQEMPFYADYPKYLGKHKEEEVILLIEREGKKIDILCKVNSNGKIGVEAKSERDFFEFKRISYGALSAVPAGISKGYKEVANYLKQFKLLFSPETEAYKSLGGFIAIGKIFPSEWNWYTFWMMTALLSIMLAVINILPIPALDGGHVMFLMYEIIVGRKPSDKFMEYAQIAGMVILLLLVVYANGNDIIKQFAK